MIDRPFLSKKLSELKELAKSNDDKIIKNIFFELSLRKSSASKFFLKELEAKYEDAHDEEFFRPRWDKEVYAYAMLDEDQRKKFFN